MPEYIEREPLYRKIAEMEELARNRVVDTPTTSPEYMRYVAQLNARTILKHIIFDTPAADVAPVVHAYWVNVVCDGYLGEHSGECSHCGERNTFRLPERAHFCSFCGAKMDLEDPQP